MSRAFETQPRYDPTASEVSEVRLPDAGPVGGELESARRMRGVRWLIDAATVVFVLLVAGVIALPFVVKSP